MDNFDVWLHQTFRRSKQHAIPGGFKVVIDPITHRMEMTAEQALRLAAWLTELASEPVREEDR